MRIITSFLMLSVATVSAQPAKDQALRAEGAQQITDIERAIQPYVAEARKTYPAAKRRFLAGLPPKYLFSLTTKLWDRSRTKCEVVFVVADEIKNGTVTGHLATQTKLSVGYKFGDKISFPESQVMDWTIVHPDGTEEGNGVGKFMDTYQPR